MFLIRFCVRIHAVMDACVASVSPVKSAPFGESRRGGLFATAPVRIALLLAVFAAALFPLVHDGVAGESERAPPPPVYVTCPDGECPAVVLCEPRVGVGRPRADMPASFVLPRRPQSANSGRAVRTVLPSRHGSQPL